MLSYIFVNIYVCYILVLAICNPFFIYKYFNILVCSRTSQLSKSALDSRQHVSHYSLVRSEGQLKNGHNEDTRNSNARG